MSENRPFFYGSSENRLNSKGQVAIPVRFRAVVPSEELTQGFVLVRGEADCVYMYTHRQFGEIKDRLRAIAKEENDAEFFRRFLENAHAVDLDAQGRFVLPAAFRADLGGADVLFVGVDDRIELWDPAKREASRSSASAFEEQRKLRAKRIFGL